MIPPTNGQRLDSIDERLRAVEQNISSIAATQKVIGGLLLVAAPVITAIVVRVIDRL